MYCLFLRYNKLVSRSSLILQIKLMKKLFCTITIVCCLLAANIAFAKITDIPILGSLIRLVQGEPAEEEMVEPFQEFDEDFVDPREVEQVLKELKDIKREITKYAKQLAKLPNSAEDQSRINELLGEVQNFESQIKAEENVREIIQDFRDAQIWDEVQEFRAKVEIPKETAQWSKEIKRIEKLWKQKKIQALVTEFGVNLEAAKAKIQEVKAGLARVQEYYQSGDWESAMEEFDDLRQDFHPGEIASVLQRLQDLSGRLKSVKDKEIKNKIKEALSEVLSNFNEEEYRLAREIMDETWNDLVKAISKALSVGKKKGYTKQNVIDTMEQLKLKMQEKGEEKREQIEEMQQRIERVENVQPMPSQPTTQPLQPTQPTQQMQPFQPSPTQGGKMQPLQPAQPLQPFQPLQPQPMQLEPTQPVPFQPLPPASSESGGGGGGGAVPQPTPAPQPTP